MKRMIIVLTALVFAALPATAFFGKAGAQTRNDSSKVVVTEHFEFPNECTNELMDVRDTTTVTCHDQIRADGKFSEKCEIRQDVTDRKSTRLNSSHGYTSYAVFCLKKENRGSPAAGPPGPSPPLSRAGPAHKRG